LRLKDLLGPVTRVKKRRSWLDLASVGGDFRRDLGRPVPVRLLWAACLALLIFRHGQPLEVHWKTAESEK